MAIKKSLAGVSKELLLTVLLLHLLDESKEGGGWQYPILQHSIKP